MIAIERAAGPNRRPEPIDQASRRLRRAGFAEPEAANLIAVKSGIAVSAQPWRVREISHLLFLRTLDRAHGTWSGADDRADESDGAIVVAGVDPARVPAPDARTSDEPKRREDADRGDGRVTLLTLFRAMAGSTATLDDLHPSRRSPTDAAGDSDQKGG